jgi:dTDP-4-amino-4,6-dideoxygalactose transaminase
MDGVMALARTHSLAVIEDGAQALGAQYKGRKAGAIGAFGTISFFPTKNLGGFGDAGALVTNDETLAERARVLRTHGAKQKYFHDAVGGNFRLDAIHAALLGVKLPHSATYTQRRRENAAVYSQKLSGLPGVRFGCLMGSACQENAGGQSAVPGGRAMEHDADEAALVLPIAYEHNFHIWNQYTIRVRGHGRRDQLRSWLRERNIGAEVYYPLPLHQQRCFLADGKASARLPVAERLASECLSLPIYPELSAQQLDAVVDAVGQFLERLEVGTPASAP